MAGLQLFQMMGDCRTAHTYHGGDIDDAFLTVAQDPEDTDAVSVTELFENIRCSLKDLCSRHLIQFFFYTLPVVMGQSGIRHKYSSFVSGLFPL